MTAVKICGIRDAQNLEAAANAGAQFAGFVFAANSPRTITADAASPLVHQTPLTTVGLFVDPQDDDLRSVLAKAPLNMIQLHGNETPMRIAAIKAAFSLPVIKAVRIAGPEDLKDIADYQAVSDWLLFDTKVHGTQGGSGRSFDWRLLKDFKSDKPWMLAGGLNPDNIKAALETLRPNAVDVSSGVESAPGIKDAGKIRAFIDTVRHA